MKKWIYLIIGIVLCINTIVAIIGIVTGHLPIHIGIIQALWGILGIYLIVKSKKKFKEVMLVKKNTVE